MLYHELNVRSTCFRPFSRDHLPFQMLLNLCRASFVCQRVRTPLLPCQAVGLSTTLANLDHAKEIRSEKFLSFSKRFFLDVKEKDGGERFLKVSEVHKGRRYTIHISSSSLDQILQGFEDGSNHHTVTGEDKSYIIQGVQNESGSYTNLIEKTLEGKQYRVAIPEEALAQFLSTLRTLKPFLDQGRPDHDAQLA